MPRRSSAVSLAPGLAWRPPREAPPVGVTVILSADVVVPRHGHGSHQDHAIGPGQASLAQRCRHAARSEGKGWYDRGGGGHQYAPIVPCVGEDQHHSFDAPGLLLQDDHTDLRLGIGEAADHFEPDASRRTLENGVDRASIQRIAAYGNLAVPAPPIPDGPMRARQNPKLRRVSQWRARGMRSYRNVKADDCPPARQLQWRREQFATLPPGEQRTRDAERAAHRSL
jgi:hypothetical protein